MQNMKIKLPKLKPVRFPGMGRETIIRQLKATQGKATKEIIAEMKELAKKDIFGSIK